MKSEAALVEIITIGDELLIGQVIDSNSAFMGQELNKIGLQVSQISSIPDNAEHIIQAIGQAFERASILLMTGGLGPTKDDITKQTLCTFFHCDLVFNSDVLQNIHHLFSDRPHVLNPLTEQQAFVPEAATIIQNKRGTAPITWFEQNGKILVSMPGVPSEMKWALTEEILPRLKSHLKTPVIVHKTILVYGIPESALAIRISEWENQLPEYIHLAYLPSPGMIRLRLSGCLEDSITLHADIDSAVIQLRSILGQAILAEEDRAVEVILGDLLKSKNLTLGTAESCTGGLLSRNMVRVPGSSTYFKGGIIAYSNEVKENLLKVSSSILQAEGAVSQPVVEQMAAGLLSLIHCDVAVAISGIAGPDGGSASKPVGTVWICVATRQKSISRRFQFGSFRERNMEMASLAGMAMVKEIIDQQ